MPIFRKQLVIAVHQLALAHCGSRLLCGHIRRAARQVKLTHAHADGAGGNQHQLVPGIFDV